MRSAFKEWAIVVDALGRGEQIVILRKGGIEEGRDGFHLEHEQFLLFPTLFHQQRESVVSAAQRRYDEIAPTMPGKDTVRIEFSVQIEGGINVPSPELAERLRGQHIWRDEVIADRFDWGRTKNIHALACRVFRLPHPRDLPMRENYGGCKSWIELDEDIDATDATPVLDDTAFRAKLRQYVAAFGGEPLP